MAFTYECDFYLQAQRLTPIEKRLPVRLGTLECISEPIQWNRDNFFDSYIEGDSSADWDILTAYSRYDRVNYQNRIYEAIEDNTGFTPTDTDYWVQAVEDFRGARERLKYNCQTLMLEWILNKWFGTNFEQPQNPPVNSDFYIVNNSRDADTFSVAEESVIDGVYVTSSTPEFTSLVEDYVGETSSYAGGTNFTVFYPVSVIVNPTDANYFQMVNLIEQYKVFGATVTYTSY
jgi:hypothetical protein